MIGSSGYEHRERVAAFQRTHKRDGQGQLALDLPVRRRKAQANRGHRDVGSLGRLKAEHFRRNDPAALYGLPEVERHQGLIDRQKKQNGGDDPEQTGDEQRPVLSHG